MKGMGGRLNMFTTPLPTRISPAAEVDLHEVKDLKAQILIEIQRRRGGVSFVELQDIPGFKGDVSMMLEGEDISNILLWPCLSQEAVSAIQDLLREHKITIKPTNFLTYAIDGCTISLPLAKRRHHYKSLRWLPVAFDLGPCPIHAKE